MAIPFAGYQSPIDSYPVGSRHRTVFVVLSFRVVFFSDNRLCFRGFRLDSLRDKFFFIIKHYKEEKAGNVFILYFQNLVLIFKNIYIYELTIIPAGGLLAFGSAYYWAALGAENFASLDAWVRVLMITGFVFSFLFLRRDIVNRQYADDRFLFSNENPGFI